jgi:hypothetical protein
MSATLESLMSQLHSLADGWSPTTLGAIIVSFIVALLSTRLYTGLTASSTDGNRPPRIPYFIPLIGSLGSYFVDPIGFLEQSA